MGQPEQKPNSINDIQWMKFATFEDENEQFVSKHVWQNNDKLNN